VVNVKCYDCETELQKGWHYCPNCKRKLRKVKSSVEENYVSCEEEGKCHACSCDLGLNWNFCPNCGTGVEFYSAKPSLEVSTMVMEDKGITVVPVSDIDADKILHTHPGGDITGALFSEGDLFKSKFGIIFFI
jgi:hypothetical protein